MRHKKLSNAPNPPLSAQISTPYKLIESCVSAYYRDYTIKGQKCLYWGLRLNKITQQKVMLFRIKTESYVIAEFVLKSQDDTFSVELDPVYYCDDIDHLEYIE